MDESIPAAVGGDPQAVTGALETVEVATGEDPRFSVIWLHGLGADGNDFVPVVPQLGLPPASPVRFIFPHAPVMPVTLNGGMRMRAWYDIRSITASRDQDEEGISRADSMIHALIDQETARGILHRNILLAGFSQGGAMAMHVALRYPERLAGLITLSSYLLFPDRLDSERHAANNKLPVFLGHGTLDPVVPLQMGEISARALNSLDYPLTWRQYPMPHSVCMEEIADIGAWMRDVMK